MKTIAIIGAGFCGSLAFYHLSKKTAQNFKILIFDKESYSTCGPAFSTKKADYILNVACNKMSAFSDNENHFWHFLQKNYPQISAKIGPDGYAPRFIFGEYLTNLKEEAISNAKQNQVPFEIINKEVLQIKQENSHEFKIVTKDKIFLCNEIFLASGFSLTNLFSNFNAKFYIKDLWNKNFSFFHGADFFKKNAITSITLIGSGLTAVDVIVSLKKEILKDQFT